MKTIGITGGIGSGKSVVSRILRSEGYAVYDCDLEARRLMERDEEMQRCIRERWGESACRDGVPDRKLIAGRVFGAAEELRWLNALVHGAVRRDVERWIAGQERRPVFVESAILCGSGLVDLCDAAILVTASEEERLRRIKLRSGLTEAEARKRMEAQRKEEGLLADSGCAVFTVRNDGSESLLDQLRELMIQNTKL